ncbi:hypothetical protein GLYMA_17G085800v4 [Glycine max]|uniref:Spermidine synthase n=1 Tax=Glycine soja TaxID=3848 RepID=A0A445G413_GLYSO|nr:hypothetical protein GLYMA_17G085800v4 [Glycine max]KAH1117485.1 hypothetical protein GYH30_046671 [Glycine max]RZB55928.1 hypothetical protein D0Y65_045267 [Glycine soja]
MWMVVLSSPQTLAQTAFLRNSIPSPTRVSLSLKTPCSSLTAKCQQQQKTQEDGIPADEVKILAKFKSRHNYIRVLEVSRKAEHPFRGSRLLLLDTPGNIHSISFLFKSLTNTYFDVFATLPPIVPPGPLALLGFGAGTAARLLLLHHPSALLHCWELDPAVIQVAREYFNLARLERDNQDRLFIYVGDALNATVPNGFSGIVVDLFSKGSLIPELQDPATWRMLRGRLRKGGRIMVNVGGSCVEAENRLRDGKVVMEETLGAMKEVFGKKVFVLSLGNRKDDSSLALTGDLPHLEEWKNRLPGPFKCYADMWTPYSHRGVHMGGRPYHKEVLIEVSC